MYECKFRLGQEVFIGGDIPGIVISACFKLSGAIEIAVAYWDGRTRCYEWVSQDELKCRT